MSTHSVSTAEREQRINIIHVDLGAPPLPWQGGRRDEECLVVFWRDEVPLAHTYARTDHDGNLTLAHLIAEFTPTEAGTRTRAAEPASAPSVSLVICTRDRPPALERCLTSLARQSRIPDEVIVVDNASQGEATRNVALAAGAIYLREDTPGLDIARNAGAKRAGSQIVAFTDDDVLLHHRWLERLVTAFDSDHVMAVTGLVLPAELETHAQILFEKYWGFGRGYRRIDFGREFFERHRPLTCPAWEIGAGASMAFRRRAFDEVGYFDERLDVGAAGCSGDSEFWYRLLAAGWTCRYEPSAVAFHFHRREQKALERQIVAYMRGHVAALLIQFERHRDWGNLRRVLVALPAWYARRWKRRIQHGVTDHDLLLFKEIRGSLEGIGFYLLTPRRRQTA